MKKNNIRKNKSMLITSGLIFLMAIGMVAGNTVLQGHAEQAIHEAASDELKADQAESGDGQAALSESEKISLEMAEWYLQDHPEMALLDEYAENPGYGDSSLELAVADVNAMDNEIVKELICQCCEELSIDVKTAKVRDLTAEQIAEIDQKAYQLSDHPKN